MWLTVAAPFILCTHRSPFSVHYLNNFFKLHLWFHMLILNLNLAIVAALLNINKIQLSWKRSDPFQPPGVPRYRVHASCHAVIQPRAPDQIQVWFMSSVSAFTPHVLLLWTCWSNPTAVAICLLTCVGGGGKGQWNENDQTWLNCCIYLWIETGCLSECLSVYVSICLTSLLALCFLSTGRDLLLQSAIVDTDQIHQKLFKQISLNLNLCFCFLGSLIVTIFSLTQIKDLLVLLCTLTCICM